MGRQQYLTRLALGRSPYQDSNAIEDSHGPAPRDAQTTRPSSQVPSGECVQQYDNKGRPINAATQARNADMRRAQNSVLALVGVVESRERSERHSETRLRHIREARHAILKVEQDRGEDLELITSLVTPFFSWWADGVLQRFVVGLYKAETPFSEVISTEWHQLLSGGLKGAYLTLFPGAVAYSTYLAARIGLDLLVSRLIDHISQLIWKKPARQETPKRLNIAMRCIFAALMAVTDVPLLPLYYYATAQQLGVAPAWPLLPPARSALPWQPISVHSFGWRPMTGLPLLRSLSIPAALLLVRMAFTADGEADVPIAGDYTAFRYPPISDEPNKLDRPAVLRDPLGRLLYHSYQLRASIVKLCGWDIFPSSHPHDGFHSIDWSTDRSVVTRDDGLTVRCVHRSTAMAHLPAQYLATRIDRFLEKLMILSLESLVWKAVAVSYLDSPLPKTAQALAAAPALYASFGGWLPWPTSAAELAYYASKIGLALALQVSVDAALCVGVSRLVHWHGVRDFNWGSKSHAGGITYAAPSSSSAN
ncbi:hypothetical protein LTR08_007518 [Meristemomyces frigidus]|nr:hypothetical protein LTR08_007518 [Meristemomyces frigidus]